MLTAERLRELFAYDPLVLEMLRQQRGILSSIQQDVHDIKLRLSQVELTLARQQFSLDRIDERVERIERRLDLIEG